jgi:hypothetical protein
MELTLVYTIHLNTEKNIVDITFVTYDIGSHVNIYDDNYTAVPIAFSGEL